MFREHSFAGATRVLSAFRSARSLVFVLSLSSSLSHPRILCSTVLFAAESLTTPEHPRASRGGLTSANRRSSSSISAAGTANGRLESSSNSSTCSTSALHQTLRGGDSVCNTTDTAASRQHSHQYAVSLVIKQTGARKGARIAATGDTHNGRVSRRVACLLVAVRCLRCSGVNVCVQVGRV